MRSGGRARPGGNRRHGWQALGAGNNQQTDSPRQHGSSNTLRRRAWHILEAPTGEQPTTEGDAVLGPALPDESTVHFVLHLALRIGEVQMLSGAGASDATATIIAITKAYGLPHTEVDIIFTSITATCHRGSDQPPVTAVRVVRGRRLDYHRLPEVGHLARRITHRPVRAEPAFPQLPPINKGQPPHPPLRPTPAWGGLAAFVTAIIGGGPLTALMSFLI